MRMTDDEYLAACEDLESETPIPCATEGCEEEVLAYDSYRDVYMCPVCGRVVKREDIEEYLQDIVDGKYD